MNVRTGLMYALCIGAALGSIAGWVARGAPAEYKIETPAPSVHYADGSVLGERAPQAKLEFTAPAKPQGSRVVRVEEIEIQPGKPPEPTPATPAECAKAAATFTCPPIRLRLDIVETTDDMIRVAAKTDDGTITTFRDIPFGKTAVAMRNHLILIGDPKHEKAGGVYLRDFGRLSFGGGFIPYIDESLPVLAVGGSW